MTETGWHRVGRALLGRWPSQVASWGEDGITAFVEELQAEGLTPEQALAGVRMHRSEFPPSVAAVSDNARRDPGRPTFEEAYQGLYGPGGVFGFKRSGVTVSPWVEAFVRFAGREWLGQLPLDDPDEGKWRRRELEQAWDRFMEASEGREVASIARRSTDGRLGRFDPAAALKAGS